MCPKCLNCLLVDIFFNFITQCYSDTCDSRNPGCPVCNDCLNKLAEPLPYAHCSQSRLYCYISGTPLNENNLPMVLPNGFVYGEQVIVRDFTIC